MKKRFGIFLISLLLIAFVTLFIHSSSANNSLQVLIDSSAENAVLRVPAGTYSGAIIINKSLTLIGEDMANTIIQTEEMTQAILVGCSGVRLERLTIKSPYVGIIMAHELSNIALDALSVSAVQYGIIVCNAVSDVSIINSSISCVGHALSIQGSRNVLVENCSLNCLSAGIYLNQFNHDISLIGNNVSNCCWGIVLQDSWHNTIKLNTLSFNQIGIQDLYKSILLEGLPAVSNNLVYLNNFVNNTLQTMLNFTVIDRWDNGTYGNFWSDYAGHDLNLDNIGDTPYAIDATNIDKYPLMIDPPFHMVDSRTIVPMVGGLSSPSISVRIR